jgi:hypothetical protein
MKLSLQQTINHPTNQNVTKREIHNRWVDLLKTEGVFYYRQLQAVKSGHSPADFWGIK